MLLLKSHSKHFCIFIQLSVWHNLSLMFPPLGDDPISYQSGKTPIYFRMSLIPQLAFLWIYFVWFISDQLTFWPLTYIFDLYNIWVDISESGHSVWNIFTGLFINLFCSQSVTSCRNSDDCRKVGFSWYLLHRRDRLLT